jgi:hypothetical protein
MLHIRKRMRVISDDSTVPNVELYDDIEQRIVYEFHAISIQAADEFIAQFCKITRRYTVDWVKFID